jgi:hypothetical protein
MNIFVLCTGRCGSVTFVEACKHMTNYTAGHETRYRMLGDDRVAYPDNHIEADNRLSWCLGRLDQRYGDNARYVHLTRDAEHVVRSFAARVGGTTILNAYRREMINRPEADVLDVSRDYVRTVTENIRAFLKDKTHVMNFALETAGEDFPRFWDWISAQGDIASAQREFQTKHNPTVAQPTAWYRQFAKNALRSVGLRRLHPGE